MAAERERIEEVFEELVELVLRGEALDIERFLARHPELSQLERERLTVRARIFAPAADAERLPFERLGDFRLLKKLGAGGMGVVYLARQESLGRLLALKLMRPELAGDATATRRFEREARAVAQLRHPGIVTVYAAGEEQGVRYLALEYLEGSSLDELLRTEGPRLEPARVVRWGRELAEALASAHARGVVHRDVKPSNVRIGLDGRARLLDFGLAQLADASALSASGSFRGTPYYASPEQVDPRGRTIDGRTDVYSLGATLYQCLTGQPPFEGASSAEVFHGILTREPRRPRELAPAISRDLETVLLTALEKDPERRYASAEAFARDLAALLEMRPIAAQPPGALTRAVKWTRRNRGTSAAVGAAFVLGLTFLAVLLGQRIQEERRFEAELAQAAAARDSGEHEEGLRSVERALALRPQDGRTLALRAELVRGAAQARAHESLARARASLAAFRAESARSGTLAGEVLPLRQAVTSRAMSATESAHLVELEGQLADLARTLEGRFAEVIEALELARGLDPDNTEADEVLAQLYLERWRTCVVAQDMRGERHYRALVEAHDHAGRHADELGATVPLTLASTPAGAEVYLFRYEEQAALVAGGEPRLVPVPVALDPSASAPPRPPGSWALRVVVGAGALEPEDLVLAVAGQPIEGTLLAAQDGHGVERFDRLIEIDGQPTRDDYDAYWLGEVGNREREFVFERFGERVSLRAKKLSALALVLSPRALVERGGVPIEVFHNGVVAELEASAGLVVRATAAPLFCTNACRAGTTPLAPTALAPGSYLALLRKSGFESLRLPFALARGRPLELAVTLLPIGTSPPGFVRVSAGPAPIGGDPEAFTSLAAAEPVLGDYWIQEREVGVREYREFVNDFATLEEIDAAPELIRVPRNLNDGTGEARWKRLDDGTFEPPAHTLGEPVHAISWHDAAAYARWLTARARERGEPFEFALPTEIEWEHAARGADRRAYPFGNRFVPRWVKGAFAREEMLLEPYLSFPIDESPCGAFDLTGSLWEWCADDWDRLGAKTLRGGAWNFTFPSFFRAASRASQEPTAADGIYGMRLVARMAPPR